ncbi:hypothetical protein VQ045_21875, partial [Aurantimonas sp. E1-2-R+4]|uniref:hypothetical protein n=1 Tax=Aurantimonas sp. E1-2-R+4 TaxID=3113714 RepID=UPI002F94BA89
SRKSDETAFPIEHLLLTENQTEHQMGTRRFKLFAGCSNVQIREGRSFANSQKMQEFRIPHYSGAVQSFGEKPAKRERDMVYRPICSQGLEPVKAAGQGAVHSPLSDRRMFAEGIMAEGMDLTSNLLWSEGAIQVGSSMAQAQAF